MATFGNSTHDYRRAMIMRKFMITGGSYQPSFKKQKKFNIGSIKTAQGTTTRVGFLAGFLDI
jgi:hypothetical protein